MRPWPPPIETVEAIAGLQCSYWAAARARPQRTFWPNSSSWLTRQVVRLAGGRILDLRRISWLVSSTGLPR